MADEDLSTLDPRRVTRGIRRFISYSGKPANAEDIFDSHTWDDASKPGLKARLTPNTTAGWLLLTGFFIFLIGFTFWAIRFFPGAYRNPDTLIFSFLIAMIPTAYVKGRQSGFKRVSRFDWSILFNGEWGRVRFGRIKGKTDDGHWKFTAAKGVSYGGWNPSFLQVRDLWPPSQVKNLRSKLHRVGRDGSGDAIDRIDKNTTQETETETLGRVLITQTDGLEDDEFGAETDRFTTKPNLFDEEVGRQLTRELEQKAEIQIPELQKQIELLQNRLQDRESLETRLIEPHLEQVRDLVTFIAMLQGRSNREGEEGIETDVSELQQRIEDGDTQ